jgi:hypothetical protein
MASPRIDLISPISTLACSPVELMPETSALAAINGVAKSLPKPYLRNLINFSISYGIRTPSRQSIGKETL